jgi:protein phosphatase
VRAAGRTDRGILRETNEDQLLLVPPAEAEPPSRPVSRQLFAVADGMGGHAGGQLAATIAVRSVGISVLPAVEALPASGSDDAFQQRVLDELRRAVERAHTGVRQEASLHPDLSCMGTTLTMAYRHGAHLFLAHAGDSRCYLLRDDQLTQITRDHTLVNSLLRRGILRSARDARLAIRNVLTNALGGASEGVKVDTHHLLLRRGDVVLLCTDGLTGMLSDHEITAVVNSYPDPDKAAERLVEIANDAGGFDNITVIVARCE